MNNILSNINIIEYNGKYNKEIKITNKKEIIIRYTIFPSYKNFWLTSNNT